MRREYESAKVKEEERKGRDEWKGWRSEWRMGEWGTNPVDSILWIAASKPYFPQELNVANVHVHE
jgi:hypothetical protein